MAAKKAKKKASISIDDAGAKWTKLTKAPTQAQVAKMPLGKVHWFKSIFPRALDTPLVCLWVKVEEGTTPSTRKTRRQWACTKAWSRSPDQGLLQ